MLLKRVSQVGAIVSHNSHGAYASHGQDLVVVLARCCCGLLWLLLPITLSAVTSATTNKPNNGAVAPAP